MSSQPKPWWRSDEIYTRTTDLPGVFNTEAGPHGPALVKVFGDGRTTGGWGLQDKGSGTFMQNYVKDVFRARKALHGFDKKQEPFAIIMRSVKMVAVDIDGKNGGLEHAKKLGYLPPTLAETSKSGAGYHLFYLLDQQWDDVEGFGSVHDRIGIEQGVDIRATGCVYHHAQQRWNDTDPVPAPQFLIDLLLAKQEERAARASFVTKVVESGDPEEVLIMQAQLEADLAQDIAPGQRNNKLFAIGQQMKQAQIEGWEQKILDRAGELGLDFDESERLVNNITRYN